MSGANVGKYSLTPTGQNVYIFEEVGQEERILNLPLGQIS